MRLFLGLYKLSDDHVPVPMHNTLEWAQWMESGNRIVGRTIKERHVISTVFLGVDHNFGYSSTPILFETMVFDPTGNDILQIRCSTWDEAVAQHKDVVRRVRSAIDN